MHKRIADTVRAGAGLLVDQFDLVRRKLCQRRVDVFNLKAEVMQSAAGFGEIACDAAVFGYRGDQFDLAFTSGQKGDLDGFGVVTLGAFQRQAERVPPEVQRGVDLRHDHGDMVDFD